MSDRRDYVIKIKHAPKSGWTCPRCGGYGYNADGSIIIGQDEIRVRPESKCSLCEGSGRVNCTPVPQGGDADE